MYNMFQQLRLFAYNQLLSKKVSSTKLDDVKGKDVPHDSKSKVLQEISANLDESERILLEKSTISCREIKSKSDTDIKDSSKTILNTAKKCLSLSDLKRHIACMNIKKFTRTQKKDTMKPNIICSSGDSEKKTESIKSRRQRCHKHVATDESPSSCDLFGFYKNRRRKNISPYEIYVQSVKPVLSKKFNKLQKFGSKDIRHEGSAKHIPFITSHHALKVITSNHTKMMAASEYEDNEFDSLDSFKKRGEPNYRRSLPRQKHNEKYKLPLKNESIMCHLTENRKHMHYSKKKRRVQIPRSVQNNHSVDVACGNVLTNQSIPVMISQKLQAIDESADQSLGLPKLITPNPPPKDEFGCSPVPCVPECECMFNQSQSVLERIENATQTSINKHQYRTRPFSCFLPKSFKKSVQYVANLHINNPDPKSIVKYILICLVVTVWSPILLAIGIGWLVSYPLRPCIVWKRNQQYNRKKVSTCKNQSSCHKTGLTKLQHVLQVCNMQPSQRQNQKEEPLAGRTLCSCRRRELRENYSVFHADCRTNPLHASQHKANTITNFFHSVFCSCDKMHQSNVRSFRARRNMVALKTNTLKEATLIDNHTTYPIKKKSPRTEQKSETIKTYPIQDKSTPTELKRISANLQTHDDLSKSDDEIKWSSFFSPFMKLIENYLVNSKYMTLGRRSESKHPQWKCSQRPTTFFSKNLRSQPKYSRGSNKRIDSPQGPFLLSKETKKQNLQKQKVINFADELFKNTETCKLSYKNTETDPLNQQIKRKNLHWKVSQTANETQTNFDKLTQKPVGHRNHTALKSPNLHLVSSNCKSPVCDKTKGAKSTSHPVLPLSELTKRQCAHSHTVNERPTSGHTESIGHMTEEATTTEIIKNTNPGTSLNLLPSVLSETSQHPLADDSSVHKSRKKVENPVSSHAKSLADTKKADAAVGTDQKSKPCANYYPKKGQSITNYEFTHARSSFIKSSFSDDIKCLCGKWNKIKKTNISIGTDQKPQPSNSSHNQNHKLTQGSSTSKYPISSEVECSCCLMGKEANATVGMNQKSKPNSSCKCSPYVEPAARLSDCGVNTENVCHCHKIKNANDTATVGMNQKSKPNSSCKCCPYVEPAVRLSDCKCPTGENTENVCHCHKIKNANAAVETDKKFNCSCQCSLIKRIKIPPACSTVCKCLIKRHSENLCHNCHKMKKANTAVETDKNSKSNTSCQCHLLKPTQFPPDLSTFCECPNIAYTETLCQNCLKKPANKAAKTGQHFGLTSSCNFQHSKHKLYNNKNLSRDGLQEGTAAVGTDTKSKFSSGERMGLNNVPYHFFNAPLQPDAVNVYDLCPISGDTNSLTNTKILKKHRKNKTAARKYNHTPEYLNVCSEVCGCIGGKPGFAHSLSMNNEKCRVNKHTRSSKCKANSPINTKNVNNCITDPIEAKQHNSLESPFNVNEYSGQCEMVEGSKSYAKIKGLNESEVNNDKVYRSSWTTRYPNTVNTCCANKHCYTKKDTLISADKPIQAKKTKICADKGQSCPCPLPPSEQRNFTVEEKKCCSSQTLKKATFAAPHSLSCYEPTCKRRKPSRAKHLTYAFYNFISGKNRRKKGNKEPFETQTSGTLIKTSDCKRRNFETESTLCYRVPTEPKSRNINTAPCPIGNLKTGGRKSCKNKSMEFNYFTMLKDLIDSKTLQKRNVSAQFNNKNRQQSNKNSCSNNMVQMQKQYPYAPSDSRVVPPLVPCACVSPRISSVRSLEHPVRTECKCPVKILEPTPSVPISCSCEHIFGQKKQQKCPPSQNSNIKKKKQRRKGLLQKKYATRGTNTPNTSDPRHYLKRCTNIQQKVSKLCCPLIVKTSKQKLFSQPGLKISKSNEQIVSSQTRSNILEPKTSVKNVKISCELISGRGDGSSNKTRRRHLRPSAQAIATDKGDNSLSFNDKRDLIKMCFKRKVKLTPSLVKCLSDSSNLVNNRRKHFPRIIKHIKYDKCCKQNKIHRIKLECHGSDRLNKPIGMTGECAFTQISMPTQPDNIKCEKGMGDAGHLKYNECECKWCKSKTMKDKPPHSSKIHHRVQHITDKNRIRKEIVKKKIIKKKYAKKKNAQKKKYPKKTVSKKSVISSKKKTGGGKELQCSDIYLATLRERPCFWIYKLLPKCYPDFLRFRLCSRTICIQCAFSLTCCFWAPFAVICFICLQMFNCCQ